MKIAKKKPKQLKEVPEFQLPKGVIFPSAVDFLEFQGFTIIKKETLGY